MKKRSYYFYSYIAYTKENDTILGRGHGTVASASPDAGRVLNEVIEYVNDLIISQDTIPNSFTVHFTAFNLVSA